MGASAVVPFHTHVDQHQHQQRSPHQQQQESIIRKAMKLKNVAITNITRKKLPVLGQAIDKFRSAPHHVRALLLFAFVIWKFVITFVILPLLLRYVFMSSLMHGHQGGLLLTEGKGTFGTHVLGAGAAAAAIPITIGDNGDPPLRVLYIAAASSRFSRGEEDNGSHNTRRMDKFGNILLRILQDGIESMVTSAMPQNFEVDAYLLLGYALEEEDVEAVAESLPEGVGYEIWDDALPANLEGRSSDTDGTLNAMKRHKALLRQQQFILRDKLLAYDFFIFSSDGTRIREEHVSHFIHMSAKLEEAQNLGPAARQGEIILPALMDVKVLVEGRSISERTDGELDFDFNFPDPVDPSLLVRSKVDTSPCCHFETVVDSKAILLRPPSDHLILWPPHNVSDSTAILHLPDTCNVCVNTQPYNLQSLSWMASREQLLRMHNEGCDFLPQYGNPTGRGGKQRLSGCRIQHVISLHPDYFTKHLLYRAVK